MKLGTGSTLAFAAAALSAALPPFSAFAQIQAPVETEAQAQDEAADGSRHAEVEAEAEAEPVSPQVEDTRGAWSFVWENDYFAGTDRNYTNGVRLSYVSPPQGESSLARRAFTDLLELDASDKVRFGAALGHSIFTPENTEVSPAPANQHPYAGWLYGEYSIYVDRGDRMDTYAAQLGVVGPSAQGEWVQNNFHEVIDSYQVLGWDDQLHDEVGFNLMYERKDREILEIDLLGVQVDATPSWGFSLGNVSTLAKAGLMFRLGDDLRADFGPPRVRPALGGASYFEPDGGFSWYVFTGVEGRAVARNIFLDGNTFQDSASVDKKNFVGDLQMGVVFQLEDVQIGYTAVARTEEFIGQGETQIFGAVSLTTRY